MVTLDRMGSAGTRRRLRGIGLHCSLAIGLLVGLASLPASSASAAGPAPTSTQPAPTATVSTVGAAIKALVKAINADRAMRHVPALSLDKRQSACSLRHSAHMAATGVASHDQFPADICVKYLSAAENVGQGFGDPTSAVLQLHQLMMNEGPCPHNPCTSSQFAAHGHYLNLINKTFKRVGIGIVVKGDSVWLTENFTN